MNQWSKVLVGAVVAGFLTTHTLKADESVPAADGAAPVAADAKKDGCKGKDGCKAKDASCKGKEAKCKGMDHKKKLSDFLVDTKVSLADKELLTVLERYVE